jgi:hypothetical protein
MPDRPPPWEGIELLRGRLPGWRIRHDATRREYTARLGDYSAHGQSIEECARAALRLAEALQLGTVAP